MVPWAIHGLRSHPPNHQANESGWGQTLLSGEIQLKEIFEKGKHGLRYAINYMYVAVVNQNNIQLVFKELPKAQRTKQRSLYS